MTGRAWIIGNAPSLAKYDMSKLKGEVTLSFNRAYIAYKDWGWQPTYFCCIDAFMLGQISDDVNGLIESGKISAFYLNVDGADDIIEADNVHLLDFTHRAGWGFDPDYFRYCGDVGAFALQVAYANGYEDVYLVGVDQSWGRYGPTAPNADTDHFRLNYETDEVRMGPVYADGHYGSWKRSISLATKPPYNMRITVTNPESRLRELLPYRSFEDLL